MSEPGEPQAEPRHFEKVPAWPSFAIIGDDVSGRVPVTRLKSWRDLTHLLEAPFFNRPREQLIFRGHRRYDWPLTPSLGRFDPRNIITQQVADAQLRLFRRAVRGRIADRTLVEFDEQNELWSVGQHHGLMTPLLDWTYSPYVALFFAFEKDDRQQGELDNPFRAIYVLNKSHVESEDRCPDVSVLEPRKDDHGRLVNQAGLFTYSSYDNTLENFLIDSLRDEVLGDVTEDEEAAELAKYICKIYIPNEERSECLRHLRMMNVHHASLFPDLLGASQYCNVLDAQEALNFRQTEIEKAGKTDTAPPEQATQSPAAEADADNVQSVRAVLSTPDEAAGVEPARLELIAEELANELAKQQFVDWEKRESVQAAMRNSARVVLRRLGYPASAREAVLDQLLGAFKQAQNGVPGQ
jgi:hypothetical protein